MKIIVFGGRFFNDRDRVFNVLDLVQQETCMIEEMILIAGGAPGADQLAYEWALEKNVFFLLFPADWEKFKKRAGFLRNTAMCKIGQPNLGVMFPGGSGTKMMRDILVADNIQVIEG